MSAIETQIAKAESRFSADVAAKAAAPIRTAPIDLVGPDVVRKRHDFLSATLPDPSEATETLERILNGNELQPISYLERGAIAAKAVARIAIRSAAGSGWGTGFLIAPGVLLTNNHVLPSSSVARGSLAQFAFELSLADQPLEPISFEFDPDRLFTTSVELDFTAVAVRARAVTGDATLAPFGWLPLVEMEGKVFEGEWLTVIQHPRGERKQVCVRENRLVKRDDPVLWYTSDTQAGSSGSPVFNNDWYVVALHHSGVPQKKDGRIQTIDGRDFDSTSMDETHVKWIANEGIRASRITKALRAALPGHPLLQPLFAATPQSARIGASPTTTAAPPPPSFTPPETARMTQSDRLPMEFRIRVEADGSARILPAGAAQEAAFVEAAAKPKPRPAKFDIDFDADYSKRKGYDVGFLGAATPVALPQLDTALRRAAAPLLGTDGQEHVLAYHNYSLVMHRKRRLAIFSAANVDFDHRFKDLSRPPDVWRRDTRIAREHQIENWYYAANNFDRGHLTRNEDMEYGPTRIAALTAAADTCHWTNCTPQHGQFNQNKQIWQGIERYILESTILDIKREVKAQVFTGPVLDEGDPEYKEIQYPVQFWKIVVALNDEGELVATAYLASQAETIAKHGIEAAPFGAFMNYQTSVAEIERLTGLTFIGKPKQLLKNLDPFMTARRRPPTRGHLNESLVSRQGSNEIYRPLSDVDDIVL